MAVSHQKGSGKRWKRRTLAEVCHPPPGANPNALHRGAPVMQRRIEGVRTTPAFTKRPKHSPFCCRVFI